MGEPGHSSVLGRYDQYLNWKKSTVIVIMQGMLEVLDKGRAVVLGLLGNDEETDGEQVRYPIYTNG